MEGVDETKEEYPKYVKLEWITSINLRGIYFLKKKKKST